MTCTTLRSMYVLRPRAHAQHASHVCREDADIWATKDPWSAKILTKEPQYFNRWPLPAVEAYLHAWHSGVVGAMVSGAAGQRVLLDASPQYMMSAAAPPRLKAAIPHARFVVLVRVRHLKHNICSCMYTTQMHGMHSTGNIRCGARNIAMPQGHVFRCVCMHPACAFLWRPLRGGRLHTQPPLHLSGCTQGHVANEI